MVYYPGKLRYWGIFMIYIYDIYDMIYVKKIFQSLDNDNYNDNNNDRAQSNSQYSFCLLVIKYSLSNRPGVAGDVLQSPPLLIHSLIH